MLNLSNNYIELFLMEKISTESLFKIVDRADYLMLRYIDICRQKYPDQNRVYLVNLANEMEVPISEISKAVTHLQDKNYVVWKTDESGRMTYVEITDVARSRMNAQNKRIERMKEKIMEEISPEALATTIETMEKVAKLVKEIR
jgi:DNA-binding MarR family transcriptional regulator